MYQKIGGQEPQSTKSAEFPAFREQVVAGLESNRKNNPLISIPFLEQMQSVPHTLPHIFVHLTVVRFSVLTKKLNKWAVRGAPERNIMGRSDTVQLGVRSLVSSIPDAAQPAYANWQS